MPQAAPRVNPNHPRVSGFSFRVAQDVPCHLSRRPGYFTPVAQDTPSLPQLTQAVGSGSGKRKPMRGSLGYAESTPAGWREEEDTPACGVACSTCGRIWGSLDYLMRHGA